MAPLSLVGERDDQFAAEVRGVWDDAAPDLLGGQSRNAGIRFRRTPWMVPKRSLPRLGRTVLLPSTGVQVPRHLRRAAASHGHAPEITSEMLGRSSIAIALEPFNCVIPPGVGGAAASEMEGELSSQDGASGAGRE